MFTVDCGNPINWLHPENRGLRNWFLALPGLAGGGSWWDLCAPAGVLGRQARLNNFTPGTAQGWRPGDRPGGRGSLRFNGSNTYGQTLDQIAIPGENRSHTHAAWVRVNGDQGGGWHFLYTDIVASGGGTALTVNSINNVTFWYNGAGAFQSSTGTVTRDIWQHVAVTYDVVTQVPKFYINGRLDSTGTATGGYAATTGTIGLGSYNSGANHFANADLDDVRSWSRVLSTAEMLEVYNGSSAGYPGRLRAVRFASAATTTQASAGVAALLAQL